MSKLTIKYIRNTGQFEFVENGISPSYCTLVACLDTSGETLEFSDLHYGVIVKNGDTVIGEKSFPPEGIKIIKSNQHCIDTYRVKWQPDMIIDIDVWMQQSFGRVEDSYQLTVPRPPQPYPSWTWDDIQKLWESPEPYPEDGKNYTWDEDELTWVEH